MTELSLNDEDLVADDSPAGRRKQALHGSAKVRAQLMKRAGPGTRLFIIVKRVVGGVFSDGFIHAGNLAYMSIVSLFPFFIAAAAIFAAIGEPWEREASIDALLSAMPGSVRDVIGPAARTVVNAREGWLLWVGGLFGMWTASSLIETIRDMLHRAYGVPSGRAFWEYRLLSVGVIFGSVLLLLVSLAAQVAISAVQEVIYALFPQLGELFSAFLFSRLIGGLALFGSIWLLFVTLTPREFHGKGYRKWPGALFVATWWVALTALLPVVLRTFFSYDLTYGSMAGVMIVLFFFWLVGLGLVTGGELNAALAETPEEREVKRLAEDDDE